MKKFERLAVVDNIDIPLEQQRTMSEFSEAPIHFPPADSNELDLPIETDGIIATWRTRLDASVIDSLPSLRYVGLCASRYIDESSCSVDLAAARIKGITVSTLGQYGDEATAEWVIAQMLNASHHIGPLGWLEQRHELFGKRLGIVGLSHMGKEVAKRASALGMDVSYWSPSSRDSSYQYLDLEKLLVTSDIISIHVAKGVQVLGAKELQMLNPEAMVVNTSIGITMDPTGLQRWLRDGRGCFISDGSIAQEIFDVAVEASNTLLNPELAASSEEMRWRKGSQLIENIEAFLNDKPIRVQ